MPTYTIDLSVPTKDLEEFIEMLRGIGAVDSLQFTIEADTRRIAVRDTTEVLNEFSATYRGVYLTEERREAIQDNLVRRDPRTVSAS